MDEKQYTQLAVKAEQVDARSRSNAHRIEELENDRKEVKEMQITLVKLADGVENMGVQIMDVREDMQDIKKGQLELSDKVTALENRPAQESKRRLDYLWEQLLLLFFSGIAGFLLANIIPGIF